MRTRRIPLISLSNKPILPYTNALQFCKKRKKILTCKIYKYFVLDLEPVLSFIKYLDHFVLFFSVSVGGLPKVTLGAMPLWSVAMPLCREGSMYPLIKPIALFNEKVIQFLAHPRTQCLWSGTAVSGRNPSSAASKLGKLDYPVRGMPSGFEFFLLKLGMAQCLLSFHHISVQGDAL